VVSEPVVVTDAAQTLGALAATVEAGAARLAPASWMQYRFAGLSLLDVAAIAAVILLTAIVLRLVRLLAARVITPLLHREVGSAGEDRLPAALHQVLRWSVLAVAWFLALSFIDLPSRPVDLQAGLWRAYMTTLLVAAGVLLFRVAAATLNFFIRRQHRRGKASELDHSLQPLLENLLKIVVFVLVIVAVVQGWGYSAAGLVAGIGIGGLALAFAAQDTIANFFGSLILYTDRPYRVGDWVVIGDADGIVEEIGLRSTRIRQLDNTLMIVPNKQVAEERIRNLSHTKSRVLTVRAGFTKDQPPERVEAAVAELKALLAGDDRLLPEHYVFVSELGELQGNIELIGYVKDISLYGFMAVQHDIILGALRVLGRHELKTSISEFTVNYGADALPTQVPWTVMAETQARIHERIEDLEEDIEANAAGASDAAAPRDERDA
jgi:MscS family membrane protein